MIKEIPSSKLAKRLGAWVVAASFAYVACPGGFASPWNLPPMPGVRAEALEETFQVARGDLKKGLELAKESLSDLEYEIAVGKMLHERALVNPKEASEELDLLEPGRAKNRAIGFVAVEWVKHDFQGCLDWARNLEDADEQASAFNLIGHHWGSVDHPAAIAYACGLPEGNRVRAVVLNGALAQWSGRAPKEAIRWVENRGLEGEENIDSARVVLRVWSANEPGEVFAHLTGGHGIDLKGKAFHEEMVRIFGSWARKDPKRATHGSLLIPNRNLANGAFTISYSDWLETSPKPAVAWAEALPPGPTKDRAIQQILGRVADTIEEKPAWSDKIDSDVVRSKALRRIVDSVPEDSVNEIMKDTERNWSPRLKSEIAGLLSHENPR